MSWVDDQLDEAIGRGQAWRGFVIGTTQALSESGVLRRVSEGELSRAVIAAESRGGFIERHFSRVWVSQSSVNRYISANIELRRDGIVMMRDWFNTLNGWTCVFIPGDVVLLRGSVMTIAFYSGGSSLDGITFDLGMMFEDLEADGMWYQRCEMYQLPGGFSSLRDMKTAPARVGPNGQRIKPKKIADPAPVFYRDLDIQGE